MPSRNGGLKRFLRNRPFMATHTYKLPKNLAGRSSKYLEEALYVRLFRNGSSLKSVSEELKKFIKTSKRVYKWEVADAIRKLRQRKWFTYALRLSEVMVKRKLVKTVGDHAMHLDLVAKVRGIAAAETYFIELHESSKKHLCYGTLLHCYCKNLMPEKAEGVMEKMKELNLSLTPMPYNSLMTLYTRLGKPEMIPNLIQEMKDSNVTLDTFTYNIWMRSLGSLNDIPGVERVMSELRVDPLAEGDWTTYSNLASIYANVGMNHKARIALLELEKNNKYKNLSAFQFLITLYGKIGNTHDVYRVWRSLRLAFPNDTANISFLNMIKVLVKFKDVAGAEKCYNEWESNCSRYDMRIPNVLMAEYVHEGKVTKAEELRIRARRKGGVANTKTWEIFMDHYLRCGDNQSAIRCLKKAAEAATDKNKWEPSHQTVEKLMEHFEEEKDVEGAEDFLRCLKKLGNIKFSMGVYESLVRTHIAAGKRSQFLRHRLKMDKVELGEESKQLLDMACVP